MDPGRRPRRPCLRLVTRAALSALWRPKANSCQLVWYHEAALYHAKNMKALTPNPVIVALRSHPPFRLSIARWAKIAAVAVLAGMCREAACADPPLPSTYLKIPWSDVDKTHSTRNPDDGSFGAIAANESARCWQAAFANILFGFNLVTDADATYQSFVQNPAWPNAGFSPPYAMAYFDGYFNNRSLPYAASAFTTSVTKEFAWQELYNGQGVMLAIRRGAIGHAVTLQGWDSVGSVIADSDADCNGDLTPCPDYVRTGDGTWHIIYQGLDWEVFGLVEVCPIPEPGAAAVLITGLAFFFIFKRSPLSNHKS